jgi:hypothetical protein
MPITFDKLAKKSPKFGVSLVKREDFNKHEEEAAAQQEAKASIGMSRTLRITYALRRDQALKAQGAMFFFSLKAVDDYLKNHARPKFDICKRCLVEMTRLKSCEGDPEGIRNDSKCPKCGDIYGCTKAHQFLLRTKYGSSNPSWKPLVSGDPPSFNLSSNWIRSTINLMRNSKDAGPKVLELLISIDNQLDNQAQEWRRQRKADIESGEIAG